MINYLLILIVLAFILPFICKKVEEQLEIFLFCIGIISVVISQTLTKELFILSLTEPIVITIAVFIFNTIFFLFQQQIKTIVYFILDKIPLRLFLALVILVLGLASSIMTAIVASLLLIAIAGQLSMDRISEVRFIILCCFSIGLGAVLTPIGEPLATIATNKLNEDFFFLFSLLGKEIIVTILGISLASFFIIQPKLTSSHLKPTIKKETFLEIIIRTLKIYLFIMGLTLLGTGMEPVIEKYLLTMSPYSIYWFNSISAFLDNATLAAAELSSQMEIPTIKAILLGLMISGGMLVPGNIPNIICANQRKITFKEWAYVGLPIGTILMLIHFFLVVIEK